MLYTYVITLCYINLKQALNHGLIMEKACRIIKFNQKAWLKSYVKMKIGLRKKAIT